MLYDYKITNDGMYFTDDGWKTCKNALELDNLSVYCNRVETKGSDNMDISLIFEDGVYKVKLSGELSYNTNSISKVEEMFGVDMASYFADAVREACRNNAIISKAKDTISKRDVIPNCKECKSLLNK
jgi:hypothetical protein